MDEPSVLSLRNVKIKSISPNPNIHLNESSQLLLKKHVSNEEKARVKVKPDTNGEEKF